MRSCEVRIFLRGLTIVHAPGVSDSRVRLAREVDGSRRTARQRRGLDRLWARGRLHLAATAPDGVCAASARNAAAEAGHRAEGKGGACGARAGTE